MKKTTLKTEHKSDWCHRCGNRDEMTFVEFSIPKNAEHSIANGDGGYFRFCENCIEDFATSIHLGAPQEDPFSLAMLQYETATKERLTRSQEDSECNCDTRIIVVQEMLSRLSPRERRVIELRYGIEDGTKHSLEDAGKKLKVTRERVRCIERKAIETLRATNKSSQERQSS